MTQTPETKTPTRAEALAALNALKKLPTAHDLNTTIGKEYPMGFEIIESVLSKTDAPIVEGLDYLVKFIEYGKKYEPAHPVESVSLYYSNGGCWSFKKELFEQIVSLYAQGRTQSAVPEDDAEFVAQYGITRLQAEFAAGHMAGRKYERGVYDRNPALYVKERSALSAAPPVTGGAWLPGVENAVVEAALKKLVNGEVLESDQRIFVSRIVRAYLNAPPSSAEKEGV